MIESVHRDQPQAQISLLVRKGNETLFANHPYLDRLFVWDKKSSKYWSLRKLSKEIRSLKFDAVINAHRFASSGWITWRSGAKYRRGYRKNPLSMLFTDTVPHSFHGEHETERNHKLVKPFVAHAEPARPQLYPSAEDFSAVKAFIEDKFYCIAPTSVWFTKQWPEEKWIELIDHLPTDVTIYLLGSPADKEMCSTLAKKSQHSKCKVLAGELTLLQSAALMAKATMNYVNDSAPMHLCSAMNAPVTAIYCSTVPEFGFGPLSEKSFIQQTTKDLSCRPCGIHGHRSCPKGHFECALTIQTDKFPQ